MIQTLLSRIQKNSENAKEELKNHTLHFLRKNESEKLLPLVQHAADRGYSAIEWIDFWGIGGINHKIVVKYLNCEITKN